MSSKAGYLSNLTPLRGMAAILVAIFHFEMAIARFVPAARTMFFEKSYLMVDLFFVLSGFIMLHVYGDSFRQTLRKDTMRHFFVARFARTYPLHLFTLLLLVLIVRYLTSWGNPPIVLEQPSDILPNVFLLQSFGVCRIYNWNIPSWSISAEWGAYLLFPFLALWIGRSRVMASAALTVLVLVAWYSIMFVLPRKNPLNPLIPVPHNLNATFDYGYLRGIAGFTAGMLIYQLYHLPVFGRIFGNDKLSVIILLLIAAGLHFAINDALIVILFAALVLNFALNNGTLHRICNNRVLQYLGDISYSIYLMQIFLQEPFSHGIRLPGVTGNARGRFNIDFAPGFLYCVVYLLLLLVLASGTYYLIERPCRKWINSRWG
ncbi:MAG TPA: acyltransferase [Puia sp.]|jgi:peptidoglycan/LPS O-acetylase OafA/YrhL|nr:acyltransferase [Puia sp.]